MSSTDTRFPGVGFRGCFDVSWVTGEEWKRNDLGEKIGLEGA